MVNKFDNNYKYIKMDGIVAYLLKIICYIIVLSSLEKVKEENNYSTLIFWYDPSLYCINTKLL